MKRILLSLSTFLLGGMAVAACSSPPAAVGHAAYRHRHSHAHPAHGHLVSRNRRRVVADPSAFRVGILTLAFVDRSRPTLDYVKSPPTVLSRVRTIEVEIRYPVAPEPGARANADLGTEMPHAAPALRFGPFPVVVFAHGYAVMPDTYRPLLDAWVRDGFVVVSPVFPVTSYYTWSRLGGGGAPEDDVGNQPADVAFVVDQLASLARSGRFARLLDLSRMAFAGHSDGAATVAALVYARYYRPSWTKMAARPRALLVLSGAELDRAGAYEPPAKGEPALLIVQSDADHCDFPENDTNLYDTVAEGSPTRSFLALHGASHIAPFVGVRPWASVVETVTADFLRLVLRSPVGTKPLTRTMLLRAADVHGVAEMSSAARVQLKLRPPLSGCGIPSPYPTPNA